MVTPHTAAKRRSPFSANSVYSYRDSLEIHLQLSGSIHLKCDRFLQPLAKLYRPDSACRGVKGTEKTEAAKCKKQIR
jgi:hypothetical protein